ncbi:hypothetical protein [Staphylococcus simiae]|uniref:Uncharacterized protein n=1 Tax=Staphylococcus simiae CCM 7213 = CCUG 51256 TaxID=911238 RepID=G5JH97_9STAP|nr:hypothetical protein [Staphylococcus simiae]EHJ08445.1 hypothetical protein SS7213T_04130 [Staphylococcus simiae CCM 7213 = CCUG 51256]PNZ12549.1 hypothetical protein CD113_06550 [Staphylococcus simiae]SNV67456.1 Uncharacterised protein [Staphylococcus simiae]
MNEPTEIRYSLDEYGEPYYPATHIKAIQGQYKNEWFEFKVRKPIVGNYAFDGENGFVNSYRTIDMGGFKLKSLRLNARNLKNGDLLATLPDNLDLPLNPHSYDIRTPNGRNPAIITLRPDGTIRFYISDSNWSDIDYIYGQYDWIE